MIKNNVQIEVNCLADAFNYIKSISKDDEFIVDITINNKKKDNSCFEEDSYYD